MRYDLVKELKGEAFLRLTGVRRSTFEEIAALLFAAKRAQKARTHRAFRASAMQAWREVVAAA